MTARPVAQSLFPDIQPDRPVGPLPLSVQTGTNSDLMWAVRDLYLTGSVLDVTYGEGKWWDRFTPDPFTAHDLYKLDGVDFRHLPKPDSSVDTVCFDPPYVLSGTNTTTAGGTFQNQYGIGTHNNHLAPGATGQSGLRALILDGFTEAARVSRRYILTKCMEFAQGPFHDYPTMIINHAASINLALHDRIVHYAGPGPGGHNIWEAKRARRAHSYLLVFAVPK